MSRGGHGELCHTFRTLQLKKLWAIKIFLHRCQDFLRLLLFEKVFLKEVLQYVDTLFYQLFGRATSLFWQSGKSDVADLEQKEQIKVWRIKPETNPKWINHRNGHTFFLTSSLCVSHCHILLLINIVFRLKQCSVISIRISFIQEFKTCSLTFLD